MTRTLRFRIGLLVGGLLLATTLAVLVSVWLSTYSHARQQAEDSLDVGRRVFEQVLAARESQLISAAEVLTADFGFRQAVASADAATIDSALQNQGARIRADLMALVNLDGSVVSNVFTALPMDRVAYWQQLTEQAVREGGASAMLVLDGRIYQTLLLTVKAPVPIAVAVVGFVVDQRLISELEQITTLDVSVVARSQGMPALLLSTLPAAQQSQLMQVPGDVWRLPFADTVDLRSASYPLFEGGGVTVEAFLTTDLNRLFSEFDLLQLEIGLIALLAISVALVMGIVFASNLTGPLRHLAQAAQALARGESQRIAAPAATVEIVDLVSAFELMQGSIRQREERIVYQATHDVTTGLINREELARQLEPRLRAGQVFHLVGLSLSNFRQINDMFGPATADRCLRSISLRLLPQVQLATRTSGGGFVGLIAGTPDLAAIAGLCSRLKTASERDGLNVTVDMHVGIVAYPSAVDDSLHLLRRLDIAMDTARYTALGIHTYQEGQEEDYVRRLQVIDDLREAMRAAGKGLQMYYQPKLNLQAGRVTRLEALIRWIHPERGFVPPDFFIPLAEQAGLINALSEWVIAEVIAQLAQWRAQGLDLQVAINLSAQDIARPDMLAVIRQLCEAHQLPAACLAFEITESEVMKKPEEAIVLLQGFRSAGFDLAIDDFGTGYSSLSQLKNMPVTELKIDREFVMKLHTDPNDQIIVRSTIALAHSFGLEIIAEGVEDAASMQLLADWGCEWAQGYHLARPLPAAQVPEWLAAHAAQAAGGDTSVTCLT